MKTVDAIDCPECNWSFVPSVGIVRCPSCGHIPEGAPASDIRFYVRVHFQRKDGTHGMNCSRPFKSWQTAELLRQNTVDLYTQLDGYKVLSSEVLKGTEQGCEVAKLIVDAGMHQDAANRHEARISETN